jgi:hypothetical protein
MKFYVGLDLGQAQDYTALSVVEKVAIKITENQKSPVSYEYQVRHLQRFKLGTPYPEIVTQVREMMAKLPDSILVVDHTGVGRPVVDLFRASGMRPIAVTITGGDTVNQEAGLWRVPKRDLVGALTVTFQNGALKIAEALPEAKTLIDELLNFKVKINVKTAHDSYEAWREGIHDDLVLSVAMAIWAAQFFKPRVIWQIEDNYAV